jgi:hypothetical protein
LAAKTLVQPLCGRGQVADDEHGMTVVFFFLPFVRRLLHYLLFNC